MIIWLCVLPKGCVQNETARIVGDVTGVEEVCFGLQKSTCRLENQERANERLDYSVEAQQASNECLEKD